MPDIDLTEAVNAAAERHYMTLISREMEKAHAAHHTFSFMPWDDLPAANRHRFAETILPAINVAAPMIAAQALRDAAEAYEQAMDDDAMFTSTWEFLRARAAQLSPLDSSDEG